MLRLIRRYAAALAALSMGLLALAAPYLIPANPDSAVFRSGTLGLDRKSTRLNSSHRL